MRGVGDCVSGVSYKHRNPVSALSTVRLPPKTTGASGSRCFATADSASRVRHEWADEALPVLQ